MYNIAMGKDQNKIIIYSSGKVNVKIKLDEETIWMTQKQIAELFSVDRTVIGRHIANIYKSTELDSKSTRAKNAHMVENRTREYESNIYNLDMIISVGYRVNSKKATQFRIWATNTLKKHLIDGYTVNKKLISSQAERFKEIKETILMIGRKAKFEVLSGHEKDLLDVISEYTKSWDILTRFDKETLSVGKVNKYIKFELTYDIYIQIIDRIKKNASKIEKGNKFLGIENSDKMKGIIGSISQTFDGKELYESVEEKAAHLLYFVVKDHPFVDGNKRVASLLFLYYLEKNRSLHKPDGERKINDNAIIALALLVATSNPGEKDNIIKLIINLIR